MPGPAPRTSVSVPNSVILNGAGYGYTTVTVPSGVRWDVALVSVSTNVVPTTTGTSAVQPVVTLYQDTGPNPSHFLEATWSGNRDTTDSSYTLIGGDAITAEWQGGTPGSVATLRIRAYQTQV